jgi:hypothetical protein
LEGRHQEHGRVTLVVGLLPQQLGDSGTVLRVQRSIDLVKQVEGGRVAALDGEDEGQCHQGLLAARQLLQGHGLRATCEGHPHLVASGQG